MLYFQVASVIVCVWQSREPIGVPAPSARPINKNWDYHAIIVAKTGKNCNPFNETSLSDSLGRGAIYFSPVGNAATQVDSLRYGVGMNHRDVGLRGL